MLHNRVIPMLLLSGERLVKTRRFADPKYVGDPINAIRIFNDKEVDELMVLDIEASKRGSEPNYALIETFAGECFMPLGYGGGVTSVEQARRLFSLGVEKICLQTAVLEDCDLVSRITALSGSQSVVVSIDVKKNWLGRSKAWASARGAAAAKPWQDLLAQAVAAGAGEIVLTSVDREGTMEGMDLDLIREAAAKTSVPVVAAGGAGSLDDMRAAFEAGASAVGVGAFFVFHGPHRAVLITYPKPEELAAIVGRAGSAAPAGARA